MYTSTLLLSGLAALSTAAPFVARDPNIFHVSNFVFGCTSGCYWYYDITVTDDSANHPATGPVHCQGNTHDQTSFQTASTVCDKISDVQHLATFIDQNNDLQIQYQYSNTTAGATYWYEGSTPVNAATSGKPQADEFNVPETKAYAVAK